MHTKLGSGLINGGGAQVAPRTRSTEGFDSTLLTCARAALTSILQRTFSKRRLSTEEGDAIVAFMEEFRTEFEGDERKQICPVLAPLATRSRCSAGTRKSIYFSIQRKNAPSSGSADTVRESQTSRAAALVTTQLNAGRQRRS